MAGYRKKNADGPNSEDKALDLFAEMMRVYQISMYLLHPPFHFVRNENSSSRHVLRVSLNFLFFHI